MSCERRAKAKAKGFSKKLLPPVRFTHNEDRQVIELVRTHPMLWNSLEPDFKNVPKKALLWAEIGKAVNKSATQCKVRWRSIRDHYKRQCRLESLGPVLVKKRATYWDRMTFLDCTEDDRQSSHSAGEEGGPGQNDLWTHMVYTKTEIESDVEEAEEVELHDRMVCSDSDESQSAGDIVSQAHVWFKRPEPEEEPPGPPDAANGRGEPTPPPNLHGSDGATTVGPTVAPVNGGGRRRKREPKEEVAEEAEEDEEEIDLFFRTMAKTVKKLDPASRTQAKITVFNAITALEIKWQQAAQS